VGHISAPAALSFGREGLSTIRCVIASEHTDANGETQLATGDKIPAEAEGVTPVKDAEQLLGAARNTNLAQQSFNRLAGHDLSMFDNLPARGALATALSTTICRGRDH